MRCGRKSRTGCWLGLVLLCLCSALSFGQSSVEIDPLGIYEISGARLIELQSTLTMQETQLDVLSRELETYRLDLTRVQSELTISKEATNALEASSMTLSALAQSAEIRATRYRSLSIFFGVTAAGGVLFILATIFGNAPVIGN